MHLIHNAGNIYQPELSQLTVVQPGTWCAISSKNSINMDPIFPHTTAYPSRLCCSCPARRSCLTLPVKIPGVEYSGYSPKPPYFSSTVTLSRSKVDIPSSISQKGEPQ